MEKQTADRLVHYYDTERHRILCGSPIADDHSTKHARGVTCQSCITLLREKVGAGAAGAAAASGSQGV
jgi:hypothetical protein